MSGQWLFLAMAAAIFVSMVLLAVVCLDCRINGPPSSISQANASEVYTDSAFRIIHPSQPSIGMNPIHSPYNRPAFSSLTITGIQERHRSFTPTVDSRSDDNLPNGSDPDYINTELEDPNYLIVIPGDDEANSDSCHDYINVPEGKLDQGLQDKQGLQGDQDLSDDQDLQEQDEDAYINVEPVHPQSVPGEAETREWQVQGGGSIRSRSSSSSSGSGSEANYVNQL